MGVILGAIGLVVLGFILCAASLRTFRSTKSFIESAVQVPAKVIEHREVHDNDGSTTFAPTYEYVFEGQARQFKSRVSSNRPPEIGSDGVVYVDPKDPNRVNAGSDLTLYFAPVMLGIFGFSSFIAGVVVFIFGKR